VSEVNILRELNNPHIVRYHDRIIAREQKKIYIVMEFCGGGDLATMIKKKQKEAKFFEEEFIWKVFAETAIALHECHRKQNGRVLHRDLKPGNVFFDSNNNVKLGDFGLARILAESSMFAQTHVGTPYYMSPEQGLSLVYYQR
jgi:NIMA (never in mitosis gene a)-related kinase